MSLNQTPLLHTDGYKSIMHVFYCPGYIMYIQHLCQLIYMKTHPCNTELQPGHSKISNFLNFDLFLWPWPLSHIPVFYVRNIASLDEEFHQEILWFMNVRRGYSPDRAKCLTFEPLIFDCEIDRCATDQGFAHVRATAPWRDTLNKIIKGSHI